MRILTFSDEIEIDTSLSSDNNDVYSVLNFLQT
jgi:hypothetical protein